jgi:hypothetical protein
MTNHPLPPLTLDQLLDAERRLTREHRQARRDGDRVGALLAAEGVANARRRINERVEAALAGLTDTVASASRPAP